MHLHTKRALVIVITNFRDEDGARAAAGAETAAQRATSFWWRACAKRIQRELAEQPLRQPLDAIVAAGAHLFEQARRDAFRRLVGFDPLGDRRRAVAAGRGAGQSLSRGQARPAAVALCARVHHPRAVGLALLVFTRNLLTRASFLLSPPECPWGR